MLKMIPMKSINEIYITRQLLFLGVALLIFVACGDDEGPQPATIIANAGSAQTVEVEDLVTLDGTGSTSESGSLTYSWAFTETPEGSSATLADASTAAPSFTADRPGVYAVLLTINDGSEENTETVLITAEEPEYMIADQMGRPAINTVFNFFDNDAKDAYNMVLPVEGDTNAMPFTDIFDALQTYIGLDPDTYQNIFAAVPGAEALGTNEGLAGALAVDVLNCNKAFPTTYGPSDLNNPVLFENVLNGRALSDDVIDVTLLLTFGGIFVDPNDPAQQNALVPGLSSDNVQENDKTFLNQFPYLAAPH